jgi:hypothetical protein
MRFGVVARGHDDKVGAIKTHARDMARRYGKDRIDGAVGPQPHDTARAMVGDPQATGDVEGKTIGLAARTQQPVTAISYRDTVVVQVMHDHAMAARVGMEKRRAVRRDRHSVALLHVAVEHSGGAVGIDSPQFAGYRGCRGVERSIPNGADIDTTGCVGAEVVHSECAVEGSENSIGSISDMQELAAANHEPAVGVPGDATNAAPIRHDGLGRAVAAQSIDASVEHITEHERAIGVDRRTFHQAIPRCKQFPRHDRTLPPLPKSLVRSGNGSIGWQGCVDIGWCARAGS